MTRSKWSKFLDKYFVYVLGIAFMILFFTIAIPYNYYQNAVWPIEEYQKREFHHRIESLYFETVHGVKVPYARFDFDNMAGIHLYNVNYEDLQVGDSVVKHKNDMHLVTYRADTLFYDSKNYESR